MTGGGRAARYVAIITDGNGRWAADRGLPVIEGHSAGADVVKARLRDAADLGVEELTVGSGEVVAIHLGPRRPLLADFLGLPPKRPLALAACDFAALVLLPPILPISPASQRLEPMKPLNRAGT